MKLLSQIKSDVNKNSNKALTSEITDKTQELQLLKDQQDNTVGRESQKYILILLS